MIDLEKTCQAVVLIAQNTASFITSNRSAVSEKQIELKALNSLVSFVDQEAEKQIVEGLKNVIPEAGFIAEEGTETYRRETYNWIVDPLDGTTNFLHGIPVYAISIALMKDEEIVLGVVLEMGQNECFYAWKGGGAYMNDKPIQVAQHAALKDTLLATGFPYHDFNRMEGFLKSLPEFFQKTRGVRRLGSAATDMAYVACGRFDGYYEYGLSPWDIAAGIVLVKEAGGVVTDFKGGDTYLFGTDIACGSSHIFEEFLTIIQKYL